MVWPPYIFSQYTTLLAVCQGVLSFVPIRAPLKNTHSVSGLIFITAAALPKYSRSQLRSAFVACISEKSLRQIPKAGSLEAPISIPLGCNIAVFTAYCGSIDSAACQGYDVLDKNIGGKAVYCLYLLPRQCCLGVKGMLIADNSLLARICMSLLWYDPSI